MSAPPLSPAASSTSLEASAVAPAANRRGVRRLLDPGVLVLIVVLLGVWAIVSRFTPAYAVPTIPSVLKELGAILSTPDSLLGLGTTLARVLIGLASSFAAGAVLGVLMGVNDLVSRFCLPLVRFVQGIPSLSWVIIAVIWFADVEIRVWFVMVLVTLPGFAMQVHDSYRAIPADLRDMACSFRPTRWALFREITLPAITPGILTAWKVNLGLGIRMVLIAELVGATIGVGAELLTAQQLFDMASVISWTLLLAVCMLVLQGVIELIENRVLRYRPAVGERGQAKPILASGKD
ncbi:ABC transporter permease [Amycolatopsis sp. FDAARGOS 1241]|uniref:ABC transporter permease n=1 Tax=Amycolatopsis sp. FDAARGOS 1241 TaxID=2778070 RepID=UPI001951F03B|nr:ABC transporter permease subunit [Amycolatopsis sp. FDAARGOS 1241]QRP50374.1 ABC transporter permease subunit [Amycolatopsis sp. FDAARGOS 1241]